jgi:Protein of unknown function (DUF3892)
MKYQVTCTVKHSTYERITAFGCTTNGVVVRFSEEEGIRRIRSGDEFFVERPAGHVVKVEIAEREGREYLKTEPDGERPDNLLALPHCKEQPKPTPPAPAFVPAGSHGFFL